MNVTKKRGLLLVLMLALVVGMISPVDVHADSASTEVTVQFNSKKVPSDKTKDDGGVPVIIDKNNKSGSGYSRIRTSNKRLPSTNDQYQAVLSQLGYIVLLFILLMIILWKRREYHYEKNQ